MKILRKAKQGTNNNGYLLGRVLGTNQMGNVTARETSLYAFLYFAIQKSLSISTVSQTGNQFHRKIVC